MLWWKIKFRDYFLEDREKSLSLQRDYQVTTGNLKKAVKRNIKRFPPDFMFQLTKEEFEKLRTNLIFQKGISRWGGTRKMPYAFTEQGLAMLSGLLNSDTAINVNNVLMRMKMLTTIFPKWRNWSVLVLEQIGQYRIICLHVTLVTP